MGQYYKAINIDNLEYVSPHDYDNGAKLMEHSYIGNNFVEAVEFLLINDGENKARWADSRIIWGGDYADFEENENFHSMVEDNGSSLFNLIETVPTNYQFLVNMTKKEYVDKEKCHVISASWTNIHVIHPLPLLLAEGNGRGGGDYHEEGDDKFVGRWARDVINVMKVAPEGFTEIIPNFDEK